MRGKDLIAATLFGGGGSDNWPEAPDDGKTRLYITLQEGRTSPMVEVCPNGTVTVDWGDGTEPDVLTGRSTSTIVNTPNHAYDAPGDYVITMTVDGEMGLKGAYGGGAYSIILRHDDRNAGVNYSYYNALKRVRIGSNSVYIGENTFGKCFSLKPVELPIGVTSIANSAFENCYSFESFAIPNGVTTIGDRAFYGCYSLASVTIPNSVTTIGERAFYGCYSLASVTIPNGVMNINGSAFYNCYSMAYYDFTHHTAVPTLSNTNAFNGIAADCEIRVPAALYDEWIAATNWATYASQIKAY